MASCPLCSAARSTPDKRRSKVLAVTLIEPEFAVYCCNHCEAQGYTRPDTPLRVVDIAEQQRQRDEAKCHAEKEKQERTRQALTLWNEAQQCRGSPIEDYLYHTRGLGDWLDNSHSSRRCFVITRAARLAVSACRACWHWSVRLRQTLPSPFIGRR
jgi:hypothetical protein